MKGYLCAYVQGARAQAVSPVPSDYTTLKIQSSVSTAPIVFSRIVLVQRRGHEPIMSRLSAVEVGRVLPSLAARLERPLSSALWWVVPIVQGVPVQLDAGLCT